MTHAVQVELICDLCQRRFKSTLEHIPNLSGRTKGTPLGSTREEAKTCGWTRLRLEVGVKRYRMTIDICPGCNTEDLTPEKLAKTKLWFEKRIKGEQ